MGKEAAYGAPWAYGNEDFLREGVCRSHSRLPCSPLASEASAERFPVEQSVTEATRAFKAVKLAKTK